LKKNGPFVTLIIYKFGLFIFGPGNPGAYVCTMDFETKNRGWKKEQFNMTSLICKFQALLKHSDLMDFTAHIRLD